MLKQNQVRRVRVQRVRLPVHVYFMEYFRSIPNSIRLGCKTVMADICKHQPAILKWLNHPIPLPPLLPRVRQLSF
ncbi:hypothetical protein M0804_014919 [Polistes exclamans]|nr:hypothetical protein M0804_014920 [Polistes exclamans]KAI4474313.1 hypothetical protein M0804_014919 [Polistes exclamans]